MFQLLIFIYNLGLMAGFSKFLFEISYTYDPLYLFFQTEPQHAIEARRSRGRTGWPQHVWALELQR